MPSANEGKRQRAAARNRSKGTRSPHVATGKRGREYLGRSRPHYAEEQIQRGLLAVAVSSGNTRKAAELLAEDGLVVDHKTLWRWSHKQHPERYEEVRARVLPLIQARAAEQHTALAARQIEVSRSLTDRLADELEEVPVRDLPGAVRNMTTAAAIHTDKAQLLRDQPTSIVHNDFADIQRMLTERSPGVVIQVGSGQPDTPPSVPEERRLPAAASAESES